MADRKIDKVELSFLREDGVFSSYKFATCWNYGEHLAFPRLDSPVVLIEREGGLIMTFGFAYEHFFQDPIGDAYGC